MLIRGQRKVISCRIPSTSLATSEVNELLGTALSRDVRVRHDLGRTGDGSRNEATNQSNGQISAVCRSTRKRNRSQDENATNEEPDLSEIVRFLPLYVQRSQRICFRDMRCKNNFCIGGLKLTRLCLSGPFNQFVRIANVSKEPLFTVIAVTTGRPR